MRMSVCVRACVRACVCVCVSVCPLAYLRNYVSNLYRILCMSLITENRFLSAGVATAAWAIHRDVYSY